MSDHEDDVQIETEGETAFPSEEEAPEALHERGEEKVAKVRGELETCRKEKQEYLDGWQRAKADYVNLLRRNEEATKAAESNGKIRAVETLLPAFDALERAKEQGEVPDGFLAIARQLESAFAVLGLEPVGEVGEEFNPAVHEAFGQDPVGESAREDTVTAVLERGWRVGTVVVRPAKVRVAVA